MREMKIRPHKAALVAALLFLVGCSGPPKILQPGEKVMTPWQCQELRRRGGEC